MELSERGRWSGLLVALALVVGACGGAAPATTASAAPAQSAAAAPAARQRIVLAITGEGVQPNKVPTMIAVEALKADAIDVDAQFLNKSEAPVEAILQGSAQIAVVSIVPVIAAVAQGADLRAVATSRTTEYQMVARKPIATAADLDGKRIGIHAEVSTTTTLAKLYMQQAPSAKARYIVVPGSPNRVTAMLANQIDASPMQLGDEAGLFQQRPNDFAVIFNYGKDMPDLVDSIVMTSAKYLAEHRDVVKSFVRRLVEAHRKVNADPALFAQKAKQFDVILPKGVDLGERAKAITQAGIFPNDGGLSVKAIDFTIAANRDTGIIAASFPAAKLVDRTVLDDVLKEIK